MSQTVVFRIVVRDPLPGVELRLQRGRTDLVLPKERSTDAATFEFELEAESRSGNVVFRGAAAQGPAAARFVYINSGTYAGQADSPWGRRAKVPLTDVRAATVPLLDDRWQLE